MLKLPRLSLPGLPALRSVGDLVSSSTVAIAVAGGGLRLTLLKGRELTYWQHVPLPPGLLHDGWIADPEEFGVALRDVLLACNLPKHRLAFALPGNVATGRLLSIRLTGATDPNALVAREAAWVMPVTPEEHYLHWQAIDDGEPDHVFVLAVRKDAVDGLLRACAVAKARPVAVDLRPLALALAVAQPDAVLADVESTSIDILILDRGLPVAMRSLHLAEGPLDREWVQEKLVEELSIAIRLHDETNPQALLDPATPVFLTGDLADGDLARRVADVTKHPTVQPEPPFSCPPGFPGARYMINLGLLLKHT